MQIETVALNKIIPYIRNPRKNENAVEKVASSIKEFGFRQPIVVDAENVIIAGHTRFEAAKRLGLDLVPVHVADGLTEQQVKAYRIADNRVGQEAEWDYDLLKLELEELDNPEMTGFDEDELNGILAEVGEGMASEEGLTDPDQVPEVPDDPVTVPGDLWELGEHRLLCGDATIEKDVERLMNGQKADMVFTDPPYGNSSSGKYGRGQLGIRTIKGDESFECIRKSFKKFHCKDFVFFLQWRTFNEAFLMLEEMNINLRTIAVWDKKNAGLNGAGGLAEQWEGILFTKDIKFKKFGGNVFSISREHKIRIDSPHPHQKPIELLIELFSFLDGYNLLFDPFLGSGSTLIACQKTGRECYGMEIDPQYCDVIITRWSEFTGKDDLLLNGKPFKWSERKIKKAA